MTTKQSTAAGLAFVATIALLLGGCGSSSTSTSSPTATTPASSIASSTSPNTLGAGTSVSVTEKDFSISLPTTTFTAGTYTFTVKNDGSLPHNLTISGPGVSNAATPNLQAGQTGTVTVTVQKGSYELFCSVPGHKDRGMDLKVQVG
jgi:uncharacterized cupredoxin-like copper-binding protein